MNLDGQIAEINIEKKKHKLEIGKKYIYFNIEIVITNINIEKY